MHAIKFLVLPIAAIILWAFVASGVLSSFSRLAETNHHQLREYVPPTAQSGLLCAHR